jgi:hypothetical protein
MKKRNLLCEKCKAKIRKAEAEEKKIYRSKFFKCPCGSVGNWGEGGVCMLCLDKQKADAEYMKTKK